MRVHKIFGSLSVTIARGSGLPISASVQPSQPPLEGVRWRNGVGHRAFQLSPRAGVCRRDGDSSKINNGGLRWVF